MLIVQLCPFTSFCSRSGHGGQFGSSSIGCPCSPQRRAHPGFLRKKSFLCTNHCPAIQQQSCSPPPDLVLCSLSSHMSSSEECFLYIYIYIYMYVYLFVLFYSFYFLLSADTGLGSTVHPHAYHGYHGALLASPAWPLLLRVLSGLACCGATRI